MSTTIKVSTATRDRVNALGAQTQQTADQVVATAIDEYERAIFWREFAVAAEAVAVDPVAAHEERREQQLWDHASRDRLDGGNGG